jgi:hypothetical protein
MTGIASGKVLDLNMTEAADHVKLMNRITSKTIGIKAAARCTTVKPAGTTSLVLCQAWMPELVPKTKDVVPAGLTVVHLAAALIPIVLDVILFISFT